MMELTAGSEGPIDTRKSLPELPYTLRTRKIPIAIGWTLVLTSGCFLPVALYYGLTYGSGLDVHNILRIINAILGVFTLIQLGIRLFRLLRKSPHSRPLGASSRFTFDFFQIQFFLGFAIVTIPILLGSESSPPNLRVLAIAPTIVAVQCGTQFLLSCYAYKKGWRAPCRISSVEKGEVIPPAIFFLIEDIVAVEGGGGREYRAALKARYEASGLFREMIYQLTLIWGIVSLLAVGITCAVIFLVPEYVAYGFGSSFPFIWAAIMAVWTIRWVQKKLELELECWNETCEWERRFIPCSLASVP